MLPSLVNLSTKQRPVRARFLSDDDPPSLFPIEPAPSPLDSDVRLQSIVAFTKIVKTDTTNWYGDPEHAFWFVKALDELLVAARTALSVPADLGPLMNLKALRPRIIQRLDSWEAGLEGEQLQAWKSRVAALDAQMKNTFATFGLPDPDN